MSVPIEQVPGHRTDITEARNGSVIVECTCGDLFLVLEDGPLIERKGHAKTLLRRHVKEQKNLLRPVVAAV